MRVGVPSEVKNNEFRVACTPAGVNEFVLHGHEVRVQRGGGDGGCGHVAARERLGAAERTRPVRPGHVRRRRWMDLGLRGRVELRI